MAKKSKDKFKEAQVNYLGRWVPEKYFRTFVYSKDGQKLARSYDEFKSLIDSGLWFQTKEEIITPTSSLTSNIDEQKDAEIKIDPEVKIKKVSRKRNGADS